MSDHWVQEIWRMITLTIGLLLIGLMVEQVFLFLFISCVIYLGWHLYNLYRLEYWFRKSKKFQPPEAHGIWGEVFYQFYRLQQRNRKRKRKLTSMLKRFQSSTAAMPDATVVLGARFEIEWFNKAATQLLGLQFSADIGQLITNLLRHPDFLNYITSKHPEKSAVKIISPVNANLILKINLVPYANNRHLLLARDITQLHRLEQIRRDFVANVSHELRTPLTVVGGFIENMVDAEDECSQQWQRALFLMQQQTTRMRSIVEDLLLLSRLESETTSNFSEPVNIANVLTELYEEAFILSGERHHNIDLQIDKKLCIAGHRDELRSTISNLIVNAIRYTPEQGKITIRWYSDIEGAHFAVRDTGEGIAAEHLPRLTERFYRVDVGRSRDQGGTGLGLAIVKHVLNRHGGHLRIESVVNQGSTFYCDFPVDKIIKCNGEL